MQNPRYIFEHFTEDIEMANSHISLNIYDEENGSSLIAAPDKDGVLIVVEDEDGNDISVVISHAQVALFAQVVHELSASPELVFEGLEDIDEDYFDPSTGAANAIPNGSTQVNVPSLTVPINPIPYQYNYLYTHAQGGTQQPSNLSGFGQTNSVQSSVCDCEACLNNPDIQNERF